MFTDRPRHSLTAEESADLKQALKHDPATPELRRAATIHVSEADEAYAEAVAPFGDGFAAGSVVDPILQVDA